MNNLQTVRAIKKLTAANVTRVYSGRPGCACGCQGNYRANPAYSKQVEKRRGYPLEPEEINLAQVKRVLALIQDAAEEVEVHVEYGYTGYIQYEFSPTRTYVAYLTEESKGLFPKETKVEEGVNLIEQ